jgi:sugar/nucleoside kinase (ribokinase family)
MRDIYSIGEMVIDFIPGSETGSYIRKAGGAPANVAIAVSKNGLKAGMCCKVGDDDFGRFLMETLHTYQVEALCPVLSKEAITTMAFVTLSDQGERTFTFARKPGADMLLSPEDVHADDIKESVLIHAGSCSLSAEPERDATEKALRLGHESGKMVSFDVNYRNLMWNDDQNACAQAVMDILPYVDLLKISEEEVDMMGGEAALPGLMQKHGVAVIVETLGSEGAKVYFQDKVFQVKGLKAKAVDATGAGDAFWGAFLSSLRIQGISAVQDLTEDILKTALVYGNVSGCICVQRKGAITSIPTRTQIEEYLKENMEERG